MKLHEEFKLYEELWEEIEEPTLETSGTTDSYTKKIGSQEYNLLDKDDFKKYLQRKFYMRTDGNGKGRYYGAYIFTMDYFISQLELAIKKIMTSVGADKKKGLLDDAMLTKIKGYTDDAVQEYKRLRDSSKFMICYEKDGRFKPGIIPDYRYTLKFYDIGDPDVAYKFIQTYGGAETVCRLLRQNNQKETLDKLTAMINKTIWGDAPAKSKYYRDNSKYKKNTTGTTTSSSNSSTDNPDEYIEHDSFFEDLKEEQDKDLVHCHNCGKEIRWSKDEVNFNYWGDEELYCEDCWYDLDLYILNREGNNAWIDAETRAVLNAD